jgi:hypothetical protein
MTLSYDNAIWSALTQVSVGSQKGPVMTTEAPLETELKVFEKHHQEWVQSHPGKFVVIQDRTVVKGFFDEFEDAFKAGIRRFGTGRDFLVKQIWKTQPVYFVA